MLTLKNNTRQHVDCTEWNTAATLLVIDIGMVEHLRCCVLLAFPSLIQAEINVRDWVNFGTFG